MKYKSKSNILLLSLFLYLSLSVPSGLSYEIEETHGIDERVKNFLESQRGKWRDLNVPEADGKVLYDLIIKHNYKNTVEVGTSTGHSATWIAWALSKTGGKLITIEINETRYNKALENFKKAGLSDYIDARLADAHELVPQLEGPIDFVFIDADKEWYTNYLKSLLPKLKVGGCFIAHNVLNLGYMRGIEEFLDYARSLSNLETTIDRSSSSGISISYKRAKKKSISFSMRLPRSLLSLAITCSQATFVQSLTYTLLHVVCMDMPPIFSTTLRTNFC